MRVHLVDKGDVNVALGVLDDFGGLGGLDVAGDVDAARGYRAVDRRQGLGGLGRLAGHHLGEAFVAVLGVARVDPLGRVAEEEIDPAAQARGALQRGPQQLLGDAGINRALQGHDGAGGKVAADGEGRRMQGAEVGLVVLVHRGRHGDDEDVAAGQRRRVVAQLGAGRRQRLPVRLAGAVEAAPQRGDARRVVVVADHRIVARQGQGQGQPDIAEADDRDARDCRHGISRMWLERLQTIRGHLMEAYERFG